MGELQSCASLVKASALCSRSHDLGLFTVECSTRNNGCSSHGEFLAPPDLSDCEEKGAKGEGVDVVAAISAELQREREKNEELMERISILEAQLKEREKAYLLTADQDGCPSSTYKSFKKFKRQKIEIRNEKVENIEVPKNTDTEIEIKHNIPCMKLEYNNQHDRAVNWMSMDVTQFLNFDKYKDGDSSADFEDTDDSDDDDDCYDGDTDINDKDRDEIDDTQVVDTSKIYSMSNEGGVEYTTPCVKQEIPADKNKVQFTDTRLCQVAGNYTNKKEHKKDNSKESKNVRRFKASLEIHSTGQELGQKGSGSLLSNRKPPKVAFCPKEVRGIMESEALLVKNAQSHTIRKIIVFASLGIRHGCEDMYELDFNHFSILRKGEPYVSPKNPGEHVLYEHPGVRRKVFYANRQNPILCPVQILEEEKAMRPSDPSCPSCLFLCIKYGGRTRNLPQNEYVRQRMGRNKLKSFGPLMCQMALLVHIRSGSFFFKALGITLLFMAGFPDDLVQRETKYRNLDLLQKYYRTDEDAEGEDLFHPYPMVSNTHTCPNSRQIPVKAISTSSKSCGKKQSHQTSKPQNTPRSEILPSISSGSMPQSQFGLMGYASVQTQAPATLQSVVSHSLTNSAPISVAPISSANPNISYMGPHPYSMLPPYPMNTFIPPPPYWHNTNTYPYPSSYGYQSFPYLAHHSQPYYSQPPCTPFVSKAVEGTRTKDPVLEEADSDSDSSSSGSEQKKSLSNCK